MLANRRFPDRRSALNFSYCNIAACILTILAASTALAQSSAPAAFLSNNGNLVGSVTSYAYDPDGAPLFVQNVITGQRESTSIYEPGCNAYTISISPDGRFLATGHASSDDPIQQVTILEVASDATMTVVCEHPAPDTPMDVEWITDDYLAVLRVEYGDQNYVLIYQYDREAQTLTEVDAGSVGLFSTSLAVHPDRNFLYVGDTYYNRIYVFSFNPADGSLTLVQTVSTSGTYPLGVSIAPNGKYLYAAGGISSGGHAVIGYSVDAKGQLTPLPGSPYESPGNSPKDFTFSKDSAYLFVGHGSDATVRSFAIDPETGDITYTGHSFDVGIQGELGDLYVSGDYLLISDNYYSGSGLYVFDVLPDGDFTMNGGLVDSQGISPREITAWMPPPPCPGDVDGDRDVDISDLAALLASYNACAGDPDYLPEADLNGDDCVTLPDLAELLAHYGEPC